MEFHPAHSADDYDAAAHRVFQSALDADMATMLPHGEIPRPAVDMPPHPMPGDDPGREGIRIKLLSTLRVR
ncbi:hypothetical protein OG896_34095 [Streptomyces sp. NBC_00669]|uniref:hypothetical protein n=1 Tax=Streptomyces sp. NBC_00669 TaxID=2976011 RepID=UPI002E2ECB14|nr:hypothetical protein [Streptomyces sp. NBC_00669]